MKQYDMVIYLAKNQLIKIIIEKRSVTNVIYNCALSLFHKRKVDTGTGVVLIQTG